MTPWLWMHASSMFQTRNIGELLHDEAVASRAHARGPRHEARQDQGLAEAAPPPGGDT